MRSSSALVGRLPNVTHRWAGIWGTTPDLMPLVGRGPGPRRRLARRRLLGSRQRARARLRRPRRARDPRRARRRSSTCSTRRGSRLHGARPSAGLELEPLRGRRARPARSRAASAIARSWIARPVESKSGDLVVVRRPSAVPGEDVADRASRPRCVDEPGLDRVRELAAVARLLPVVAEETCARASSRGRRPPPCPGRRRPSATRAARGAATPSRDQHSCPGVTVTTMSAASASSSDAATPQPSSRATSLRARAVDVPERDRTAARDERPRGGAAVHACADDGRRRRHRRARASRLRAPRPRPVRSAVTEPASSTARSCPLSASDTSTTPLTVGRPCAGCRGTS